jgi:hypothetical protein
MHEQLEMDLFLDVDVHFLKLRSFYHMLSAKS